ncbi:hypothetical protein AK812_SmicGene23594 [Symbiodinium microadriaticum]|uniref:Microbial-type PARG catalytic domain-containing protein n=1 Tax=Symbiodinium microadriaticum TaxID=2951 RepID=A0A1Q9DGW0_SYMMI|nr:hypothetical protein AK812_SmicGene23594 [Symbiodinium microadriaticum]
MLAIEPLHLRGLRTFECAEELGVQLSYYRYRSLGGVLRRAVQIDTATHGRANPDSDGSFGWIRKANMETDRSARRRIAGKTQESIDARGYILENKSVLLRHVSSSLAGTRLVSPTCGSWPTADSWLAEMRGEPKAPVFEQKTVFEAAEEYCKRGFRVAAVNAASAYHAGGGFATGGRHALEESMCIQSTLFPSLQLGEALAKKAGVASPSFVPCRRDGSPWTPHLPADGVLLSPSVEVFRSGTNEGYPFLATPFQLQVTMPGQPAHICNALKSRWRATLVAAIEANANCVVLPDAGCGVFKNDPKAKPQRKPGWKLLHDPPSRVALLSDEIVIASPAPAGRVFAEAAAQALDPNPLAQLPEPTSPSSPSGASWLFETNHGFHPFFQDCQVVLEQKYQQFRNGGPAQVWVTSAGKNIKVDFQFLG